MDVLFELLFIGWIKHYFSVLCLVFLHDLLPKNSIFRGIFCWFRGEALLFVVFSFSFNLKVGV